MVLTFEHLQSCSGSGRLAESFQSTILNAYKSKSTQSVMFYACSLDPENCGTRFVSTLVDIFKSSTHPKDWRSILGIPRLKAQLLDMPIEAILKHRLNPLEVCLPSIVDEFLRQAKAARLFHVLGTFVFHESELSKAFGGLERLDSFFPFDPYLLKKSDREEI